MVMKTVLVSQLFLRESIYKTKQGSSMDVMCLWNKMYESGKVWKYRQVKKQNWRSVPEPGAGLTDRADPSPPVFTDRLRSRDIRTLIS